MGADARNFPNYAARTGHIVNTGRKEALRHARSIKDRTHRLEAVKAVKDLFEARELEQLKAQLAAQFQREAQRRQVKP